jgi:hypothetical protein
LAALVPLTTFQGQRAAAKLLGAIGLAVLPGCSDAIGPDELPVCAGAVTLEVTTETTPGFLWTPACRLSSLLVEAADDGTAVWAIITRGENALAPPVAYGEPPAGAETLMPPAPLTSGSGYRITVARWVGPEGDDGQNIGVESFEP